MTSPVPPAQRCARLGNQVTFRKALRGKDTVYMPLPGFGPTAADYRFTIENKKSGAGLRITGDRPLSKVVLWSIRSVLSLEPFIEMTIKPDEEFTCAHVHVSHVGKLPD